MTNRKFPLRLTSILVFLFEAGFIFQGCAAALGAEDEARRLNCLTSFYARQIRLSPDGAQILVGDELISLKDGAAGESVSLSRRNAPIEGVDFLGDGSGLAGILFHQGWEATFEELYAGAKLETFMLDKERGYTGVGAYLSALPSNYRDVIRASVDRAYTRGDLDEVGYLKENFNTKTLSIDQDGLTGWVEASDSESPKVHLQNKTFPSPGYGPLALAGGLNGWVRPVINIQKNAAGDYYITSDAMIFALKGHSLKSQLTGRAAFFSRPLTDSRTGYLIGTYDDRGFYGLRGSKWLSSVKVDYPNEIIIGATVLQREQTVAWTYWANGRVRLQVKSLTAGKEFQRALGAGCEYAETRNQVEYETLLLGRDWKVPARLFAQAKTPSRGLVVYVHGGPGGSFQDLNRTAGSIKPYLDDGFDVLAVDYSGALGTGPLMSERLREYGGKALEKDAAAIRRYIEKSAYARIGVVGGSMGSLVSTQLATSRRVNALFLEVPWFDFHLPPGFDKPEAAPYRADLLSDFKDALGSDLSDADSEFRRWMRALRENCQTRKDLAVFVAYGKDDYKVRPEDLPSCFEDATIEVLEGGHSFTNGIESDAPMRTRFMNMLAPRPVNDPPN